MRIQVIGIFKRNFLTALPVLLLFKLGLFANAIFGYEGYEQGYKLLAKLPLLLGIDILGAFLVALFASLLTLPFLKSRHAWAAPFVSLFVQVLHGLLVAVSFFATLYSGGPLNKEVIELAAMESDAPAGSAPAMWSSVAHYLGLGQITTFIGVIVVVLCAYRYLPRFVAGMSVRLKKLVKLVLISEAAFTLFLLPWLINGHVGGIRIHTFGLERSPGVELAWSYVRPVKHYFKAAPSGSHRGFYLDMSSEVQNELLAGNPFSRARKKKTNVVFISLESVAMPYIAEEPGRMPFLSSVGISQRGVSLGNHYSVWPQTMKAFFSEFCSELPYPSYQPITTVNPSVPCVSLSEALHEAGYFNALITSADLAYDRKMRFFKHRKFDLAWDMRNMPGREGVWGDSWGLDERLAVKNILAVADEHRDDPFFIFYEMFTAHHPYNACREHADNPIDDEEAAYYRALKYIDDRVRDLVGGLEKLGLADNTLVVIASDHGEGFGQHAGSRSHGPKIYQENIWVPAAFIGPQLGQVHARTSFSTSHIDLAPTILGLLGIDVPCTMKGRDFTAGASARVAFFGGRPPGAQMGLADGHWKYIIEENGLEMLFDLSQDPLERVNLAGEHEELRAKYKAKVDSWIAHSSHLIENYAQVRREHKCL